VPFSIIPCYYWLYKDRDYVQYHWDFESKHKTGTQCTSNVCGLEESPLENISFKNIKLKVQGGITEWDPAVPDIAPPYPEVFVYGKVLPAKGIFFRHAKGVTIENFEVTSYKEDGREDFVFEKVENLNVTGPEMVNVRYAATRLGKLLGKEPIFEGEEGDRGILCNASKCIRNYGYPDMGLEEMIEKQAEWVLAGGRQLGKPTHLEESKGKF
jgi:hypothetical protein